MTKKDVHNRDCRGQKFMLGNRYDYCITDGYSYGDKEYEKKPYCYYGRKDWEWDYCNGFYFINILKITQANCVQ